VGASKGVGIGKDGSEDGSDGGAGGDDGGGGVSGIGGVCDDGSPKDGVRVVDGTGSTDPVVGRGVPVTDDSSEEAVGGEAGGGGVHGRGDSCKSTTIQTFLLRFT
jgi:hypothetical protein